MNYFLRLKKHHYLKYFVIDYSIFKNCLLITTLFGYNLNIIF